MLSRYRLFSAFKLFLSSTQNPCGVLHPTRNSLVEFWAFFKLFFGRSSEN